MHWIKTCAAAMAVASTTVGPVAAKTYPAPARISPVTERVQAHKAGGKVTLTLRTGVYELYVPASYDGLLSGSEALKATAGGIFGRRSNGAKVAFECVLGFNQTLTARITPVGVPASHELLSCYGPDSADSWNILIPNGSRAAIEAGLAQVRGTGAEKGIFGRKGSVLFFGFSQRYYVHSVHRSSSCRALAGRGSAY